MKPQILAACLLLAVLAAGIITVSSLNSSNAESDIHQRQLFSDTQPDAVIETKTPEQILAENAELAAAPAAAVPNEDELTDRERKIRAAEAEADDLPRIKLETNKGTLVIEMFENEAPNHVANFVSLVEKGYYDGLTFHRVLQGFMAQGGCPTGTGTGNPGYRIKAEFTRPDHRKHFTGTLSMARSNHPDSAGSQFFLCFSRAGTSFLDGNYTAFGRVIQGFEVLPKITLRDPGSPTARTITPDRIIKATVLRKRDHEYKPETLPLK